MSAKSTRAVRLSAEHAQTVFALYSIYPESVHAAVENAVKTGAVTQRGVWSLLGKYGGLALPILAALFQIIASGGTIDMSTILTILAQFKDTPQAKAIIHDILAMMGVTIPGF